MCTVTLTHKESDVDLHLTAWNVVRIVHFQTAVTYTPVH